MDRLSKTVLERKQQRKDVNLYDDHFCLQFCKLLTNISSSKYEVNIYVTQDAMYGGVATWDREKNKFNIHKSGQIFHCNRLSL